MIPLIVITRDRVAYTRQCLASLEAYDVDITVVDHGSTYPPMLDWLNDFHDHALYRRGDLPPRALWEWDLLPEIVRDSRYLVTDPDLVLDDRTPYDWLLRMKDELDHGGGIKVGLGLRLDDLPDTEVGRKIRVWEGQYWTMRSPSGAGWRAPVDTTIALYESLDVAPRFATDPAVRLDAPYLARHLPWYDTLADEESNYYRAHALPGTSHWINGGW